jgi:hypothetical protein
MGLIHASQAQSRHKLRCSKCWAASKLAVFRGVFPLFSGQRILTGGANNSVYRERLDREMVGVEGYGVRGAPPRDQTMLTVRFYAFGE